MPPQCLQIGGLCSKKVRATALFFVHSKKKLYLCALFANFRMMSTKTTTILYLCALAMTVSAAEAAADRDSVAAQLRLQEVEVLSQQTEINAQAFRLVTEISRDEMASVPAVTIADLLQNIPGLDVRTRGANGGQADVSMRGGTFDQLLIMLNGVSVSDAQTGHYALNIPIPVSAIERIEVLEGASSSLVSGNAFVGAINIVTLQPEKDTYNVSMQLGMNRFADAELTGGWRRNNWRVVAAAEYSHTNGYYAPEPSEKEQIALDNTDFDIANLYLNAAWKGLELQAGAQYKDVGAGMFYGFGSQNQFDATRTAFGSARYTHDWGKWSLDAQLSYRANHDHYQWHRGQPEYSNTHLAQNATAGLRAHYSSSVGKTTLGVELRDEHIRSSNIGTHNRLNFNYFAQQTFHVQGFSASLAASGTYNTSFGHHWSAGADLGYTFGCGVTLYANANRSLRMPTFTDLYYDAGNQLGSKDLKPEKAWTASFGTAYKQSFDKAGTLAAKAEIYHRWGRDIIDWIYVPEDTKRPYHAQNQQRVNALGVECGVQYCLNEWLRRIEVRYAYTTLDINLEQTNSRYLDYLRHKLVVRLEHGIYKGLGASWAFHFRARQGQFNDAEGDVRNYRPVCLLDGEIYYKLKQWRIALECTNMTNRHYYDYGGLLQPGAWAKLHVTYQY